MSVSRDIVPYLVASLWPHHAGVDDSIVVEQFKALGDPVRLAIVRELRSGMRCACELAEATDASPQLLSHHLKVLRKAGLINGTKRGRWVDYRLDAAALRELLAGFELEEAARIGAGSVSEQAGVTTQLVKQ